MRENEETWLRWNSWMNSLVSVTFSTLLTFLFTAVSNAMSAHKHTQKSFLLISSLKELPYYCRSALRLSSQESVFCNETHSGDWMRKTCSAGSYGKKKFSELVQKGKGGGASCKGRERGVAYIRQCRVLGKGGGVCIPLQLWDNQDQCKQQPEATKYFVLSGSKWNNTHKSINSWNNLF